MKNIQAYNLKYYNFFMRLCLDCNASSLFLITEFHLLFFSSYLCYMAAGFVKCAKETSPDWLLFAISAVYAAS